MEKRRFERYRPTETTIASFRDGLIKARVGIVCNISKGGALVEYLSAEDLQSGIEGRLKLSVPSSRLHLESIPCKVVHNSEIRRGYCEYIRPDPVWRCGVQFINMTPGDEEMLDRLIGMLGP
jgi:hypothetical protein